MDIRQLKYFLAIAEEEQITGAAKRLHMAQPPLSQQLRLLEEELGVKLLERGSRKIQLTDAGEMLRNRAEQILKLTETTIKELKDFNKGSAGTLSIGAVSSSGAVLVPDKVKRFHDNYPNINFEIWEGNTYRILEILNSGVVEIGIVRTPFSMENYEYIYLSKEAMTAVYSGDSYFGKVRDVICLSDLKDRPLIIYRRFEKLIQDSCHKAGFEPRILCRTDDARTTLLWADSNMGIAIVPEAAIKLAPSSNLKQIKIEEPSLETQIAAIWMKNRYLSAAARHFLKNL